MDLTRWNDGTDAELEQLVGGDLELLELGRRLRAARPEPLVDPDFQRRLRAQLMTAAETQLRPRGLRRLLRPRARIFAYGAAGLGTAMATVAALAYYAPHSDNVSFVTVTAPINGHPSVSPDQVITIAFNHPMDEGAVVRGLTIQPAIDYTPRWQDNSLVITPKHDLQPNTPYVVTIPRNAARDLRGDVASKDITITFGTSPVAPSSPTGRPQGPVTLTGNEAGAVLDGSILGFAGDGSLLAGAGLLPGGAPDTSPPAPALVRYGAGGPAHIGDPVTAIALSPAGHSLATLTSAGVVALSDMDGGHRSVLSTAADSGSPLAWGGEAGRPVVLFVSGGQLTQVDLENHQRTLSSLHLDPGQAVLRIAPGGRYVFVGPSPAAQPVIPGVPVPAAPVQPGGGLHLPGLQIGQGSGSGASTGSGSAGTDAVPLFTDPPAARIVDLGGPGSPAAAPLPLQGLASGDAPVFSGDGSHAAWIDVSGAQPVIDVQALGGTDPATHVALPKLATGDGYADLTLDPTGDRVAYALSHQDGGAQLRLVRVGDGALLATGTVHQPSGLVFSPDGGELGYLQKGTNGTVADVATVPGSTSAGAAVPRLASLAIDNLVSAEVDPAHKGLSALVPTGNLDDFLAHLPSGLSRGYVIAAVTGPTGDTVTAHIRLLRDPTSDHPTASFTDQTVTLKSAGENAYLVSGYDNPPPLHDEPIGPQVAHVDTVRLPGLTSVRITFDSDLDPSSVTSSAISLTGAGSGLLSPSVRYDPATRTVTVLLGLVRQPLKLSVGIGVRDVNGQGLAQAFTTEVSPAR